MLTPVFHVRIIVFEDGEIRVGLVRRAGSTVFGGEHFNGTRDESAVVITGIFHAAVVVVQPPEVGTGVRGAVLNHHLAEERRSGISVLLVGVQAREHEVVGDPCGHTVKRCALLLLIGGTATDVRINAELIMDMKKTMSELTAEQTGHTVEEIYRDNEYDHWFTAQEALEYGFVDKLVSTHDTMSATKGE